MVLWPRSRSHTVGGGTEEPGEKSCKSEVEPFPTYLPTPEPPGLQEEGYGLRNCLQHNLNFHSVESTL